MINIHNLTDLIKNLDRLSAGLPGSMARAANDQITTLRRLFLDARPPALMIIGRNSKARQNLVKSLFKSDPESEQRISLTPDKNSAWTIHSSTLGSMNILESDEITLQNIETDLTRHVPDCIVIMLNLVYPGQDQTSLFKRLKTIMGLSKTSNKFSPFIFFLMRVERNVGGVNNGSPGQFTDNQDVERIRRVTQESGLDNVQVMLIPKGLFSENRSAAGTDASQTTSRIVQAIAGVLPLSARLQFARLCGNKDVQKQVAETIIRPMATACGAIALNPFPVADIMPMTSAQLAMVSGIGCVSGREMSRKTALEFLSAAGINIGGSFALREASRAICKIMAPVAGSAASAGVAYAGTIAVGRAASAYFIDEKPMSRVKDILKQFKNKDKKFPATK